MTSTWRQNWGVTALYVTPTQESGGSFDPRTPQDRRHYIGLLMRQPDSKFLSVFNTDSYLLARTQRVKMYPPLFQMWGAQKIFFVRFARESRFVPPTLKTVAPPLSSPALRAERVGKQQAAKTACSGLRKSLKCNAFRVI